MTYLHGFICECTNRRCKERVRLTPAEYAELSRYGAVVSPECGRMDERQSLLALPVLRVLPTKMGGGGDVGL
jgi:hypothetical protein